MSELQGKAIVMSGRFSRTKAMLKQELLKVGAKVRSEVSSKTDIMARGKNPGFYDVVRAERFGTTVIDEETLFAWLAAAPEVEPEPVAEQPPEPEAAEMETLFLTPEELQGKKVLSCGRFPKRSQEEVLFVLEEFGAQRVKEVESADFVFVGRKGAARFKKALELNIPVVNEEGFLALNEVYEAQEAERTVALPPEMEAINLSLFKYRECCITGEFETWTAEQLRAILKRSGVRVRRDIHENTQVVFAGRNWDDRLRQVVSRHGSVWTEGQILLYLDGIGQMDFPRPQDIPNGENLDSLEAIERGETVVQLPEEVEGELLLRWKRVEFPIHLRFAETYGHIYRGIQQPYVGRLFYNGEELQPNVDAFYGPESYHVTHFDELGNDGESLEVRSEGRHGFNCSFLFLDEDRDKEIRLRGKDGFYSMTRVWEERNCYGNVAVLCEHVDLSVHLEKKVFTFTHHMGPYLVSPWNAWV
jgi:BRCT domain type II-containing protein